MPRLTDARVAAIPLPQSGQQEHLDELVTGLRLRVGAGGRKAWIVRVRAGRKMLTKTLGAYPHLGLADARDAARGLLIQIAKEGSPKDKKTFGDAARHWIDNIAKARNSSWRNQERQLELHVLPHWREKDLDSLTRGDVRDLIDGIDGEVAPARVLAIIKTIMRYALYRDWLEVSPADAIPPPGAYVPRDHYLAMPDLARVYRAADLLGYPNAGFVKLLILTGQRRMEVASMRWDQVDLKAKTWVIPGENSKNDRAQLVPLSTQAADLLSKQPQIGPFVWTTDGETHIRGFSKAKSRLDTFLADPPLAAWRFHDLRRSMATHAVRLGVLEEVVERLLNHTPKGVTARVYALHSYEPEKRAALDAWSAEIENACADI